MGDPVCRRTNSNFVPRAKNSRFESAVRILLFAVLSKKQVRKGPFLTIANRLKKHRF